MKKEFSTAWRSSKQPRKQRKYRANAPKHLKRKFVSSHLSKDLKTQYSKRSVVLKKGDEIKIMVGKFKGKTGKVTVIDTSRLKVYVDGIQRGKVDGTKVNVPLDPSNLLITKLDLEDKKRMEAITNKRK